MTRHRDDLDYRPVDHDMVTFAPFGDPLPIEVEGVDVQVLTVFEEVALADLESRCRGVGSRKGKRQ